MTHLEIYKEWVKEQTKNEVEHLRFSLDFFFECIEALRYNDAKASEIFPHFLNGNDAEFMCRLREFVSERIAEEAQELAEAKAEYRSDQDMIIELKERFGCSD